MKVLVTGCSGILGSALWVSIRENFETYGTYSKHKVEVKGCATMQLDITDARKVTALIKKISPEFIVHSAALVGVNACEHSPELAEKINCKGTENIAKASIKQNSKLLYVSTDYVFDGKKGMYREDDETIPINVYGKTKLKGEKTALKADACIIRTSIHGWNIFPERPSFTSWVIEALKSQKIIDVFDDQFNSIMLVNNLAEFVEEAIKTEKKGVYHIAGNERISKSDFAMKIAKIFGLDRSLINPVKTRENLKATRPMDVSLSIAKAKKEFSSRAFDAEQGIMIMNDLYEKEYMENFKVE